MSNFRAFMKGEEKKKTKNIIVSDRFSDEEGNLVPVTIQTLSTSELKYCRNQAKIEDENGSSALDSDIFEMELLKKSIIFPDLRSTELQDSYGVMGEDDLITEMFTAGEYTYLTNEIQKFNGFNGYNVKVEKVKN